MRSPRESAEALAICVEYEIVPIAEVITWADSQMLDSEVPEVALCDLSMASSLHRDEVAALLRQISVHVEQSTIVRQVMVSMLAALKSRTCPPERIAHALFRLTISDFLPEGKLRSHAYWFDDALDLSQQGHIPDSTEEIIQKMVTFLDVWLQDQHSG